MEEAIDIKGGIGDILGSGERTQIR